jgi:hypothetical protein
MKEQIKLFLKPSIAKVAFALVLLGWQYFYSYQKIRLEFLAGIGDYLTKSLSNFNWGSYFVRNLSLFFIWIISAVVIFITMWLLEIFFTSVHNLRVRKKYLNQPGIDYTHLLRDNKKLLDHMHSRSLWLTGILITLISLFSISDLIEGLRLSIIEDLMWNAFESGTIVDFNSTNYTIWSFVALSLVWYLIASLIIWIFTRQKVEENEEIIAEEHYAVSMNDSNNEEGS